MTAQILDGRALATTVRGELESEVASFVEKTGVVPTIAVVRAGEDEASVRYARTIEKTFAARGMGFSLHTLTESAQLDEILDLVRSLNGNPAVHGIMIQEPMPKGIDEAAVVDALSPEKDVDGVHPVNAGRLMLNTPPFHAPATPAGGMEILKRYEIPLKGTRATIVGRSNIVGRPMALLLMHQHATITVCHSRTVDLAARCREADLLVAAVGKARLIRGDWVKPGAVVIDFGVNFVDGKMVGDVHFDEAVDVAGHITPVPGGTGPMTNVMLARNTLAAARGQLAL